jgi:hypothetical protein
MFAKKSAKNSAQHQLKNHRINQLNSLCIDQLNNPLKKLAELLAVDCVRKKSADYSIKNFRLKMSEKQLNIS